MSEKQHQTKKIDNERHASSTSVRDPSQSDAAPISTQHKELFDRLPADSATRSLRQAALLDLQRRYGNGSVCRLLAKSATLDPVALKAEKIRLDAATTETTIETEEEEEPSDRIRLDVDSRLAVGSPDDVYEQEADRVAARVAESSAALESPAGEAGLGHVLEHMATGETASRLLGSTGVQKLDISKSKRCSPVVVRVSRLSGKASSGELTVSAATGARILDSKRKGKELPDSIRRKLEVQMGYDFSHVRVNDTAEAAGLCRHLGARAFAHGRDIWLGRGESVHDVRLMAHELTHVVQQGAAMPLSPKRIVERLDLRREMLKRFEKLIWGKTRDVARYRQRMHEFQRHMSSDAVDALQRQLLGSQSPVEIHQKDNPQRLRALYGGGGGAPSQFPTIREAARDSRVSAARNADWTAGESDYAERFAWITWDSSNNQFNVTGRTTGTWQGVTPGAKPSDSGTVYHAGEYHQHPPLPPAQRGNTHSYPVGPSPEDRTAANADNSPGIVRDFTTTARTTVTDYTYGPTRRSGRP